MQKSYVYWAVVVGLLSVVAQVTTFYVRFGRWNTSSSIGDYALFFAAGALGGLMLAYLLNWQNSKAAWYGTLLAFLLASPIALVMMVGGGLLGPIGVLMFPQISWALFAWIGGVLGTLFARK